MAKAAGTDPLGGAEVADLLEVKRGTVRIWQFRGVFPPPDWASVNGLPAWRRSTILRWARRTGRLPESLGGGGPDVRRGEPHDPPEVGGDAYAETEPGIAGAI